MYFFSWDKRLKFAVTMSDPILHKVVDDSLSLTENQHKQEKTFKTTKSDSVNYIIIYKTIIYYFSHFTRHQIVWLTRGLLWRLHGTLRVQTDSKETLGLFRGMKHNLQLHNNISLSACQQGGTDGSSLVASTLGKSAPFVGKIQTNKTHSAQL